MPHRRRDTPIDRMPTPSRIAPACFGMACPRHDRCARYAAVDDSAADPATLVTCTDGRSYPMFLGLVPARTRAGLPVPLRAGAF